MDQRAPLPAGLFSRPDDYLLELAGPNALFARMSRESYQRSIFLDRGRIVAAAPHVAPVGLGRLIEECTASSAPPRPIDFILHVAHCGSTLLARAVDRPGRNLVLREPYPLRQLGVESVATPAGPRDRAAWSGVLGLVVRLLGRRYRPDEQVIVKANVPVNFMLDELLEAAPGSTALLLYARLEDYLPTLLKTPGHQGWAGNLLRELWHGVPQCLAGTDPATLSPGETVAALWIAQLDRYARLQRSGLTVRSLDCERLFREPRRALAAAFEFWGRELPAAELDALVAGDLFTHHAKTPDFRYDNAARRAELDEVRRRCQAEIDAALRWSEQRLEGLDIDAALAQPLPM